MKNVQRNSSEIFKPLVYFWRFSKIRVRDNWERSRTVFYHTIFWLNRDYRPWRCSVSWKISQKARLIDVLVLLSTSIYQRKAETVSDAFLIFILYKGKESSTLTQLKRRDPKYRLYHKLNINVTSLWWLYFYKDLSVENIAV